MNEGQKLTTKRIPLQAEKEGGLKMMWLVVDY